MLIEPFPKSGHRTVQNNPILLLKPLLAVRPTPQNSLNRTPPKTPNPETAPQNNQPQIAVSQDHPASSNSPEIEVWPPCCVLDWCYWLFEGLEDWLLLFWLELGLFLVGSGLIGTCCQIGHYIVVTCGLHWFLDFFNFWYVLLRILLYSIDSSNTLFLNTISTLHPLPTLSPLIHSTPFPVPTVRADSYRPLR